MRPKQSYVRTGHPMPYPNATKLLLRHSAAYISTFSPSKGVIFQWTKEVHTFTVGVKSIRTEVNGKPLQISTHAWCTQDWTWKEGALYTAYTFTVLVNFPEGGTIVRHSNGVFTEEDGSSVSEYVFSRVELVRIITPEARINRRIVTNIFYTRKRTRTETCNETWV